MTSGYVASATGVATVARNEAKAIRRAEIYLAEAIVNCDDGVAVVGNLLLQSGDSVM